jgi:putative phosphoribosyl transferase
MCADRRNVGVEPGRDVEIPTGTLALPGRLALPPDAHAIVIFAHGSGSSRASPRNRQVAAALEEGGFGTLLFDLLTEREAAERAKVFDIPLLGERLAQATGWVRAQADLEHFRIGYFGASTGASAALWAGAERGGEVSAVVSRGGRPDLAGARLSRVEAPTLLIVGGEDHVVLQLNRQAQTQMHGHSELVVVAGATHLFEESGALEQVCEHAANWFGRYLASPAG